jgi:hypothetical protein
MHSALKSSHDKSLKVLGLGSAIAGTPPLTISFEIEIEDEDEDEDEELPFGWYGG